MRKGFYFSFDAFLALTILAVTFTFMLGTSDPATTRSSIDSTISSYRTANSLSEDASQLATRSTLEQAFGDAYVDDYINDTVLEEEDRKKSVLDVIAILWAAGDTKTAQNITQKFFNDTISDEYGYRLNIIDNEGTSVIYNTTNVSQINVSTRANAKRLVSGVDKNKPNNGYIARARAEKTEQNTTDVFSMPILGSAVKQGESNALKVTRKFHIDAEDINNATLYLSIHTGGSDPNSMTVEVNGQDAEFPNEWDYEEEKNGKNLLFHSEDVTSLLEDGWNEVFVEAKNTGGADATESVHFHPGSRIEVSYKSNKTKNITGTFEKKQYFSNVNTEGHNSQDHGVWAIMSYYIPQNADVKNVTLNLSALDVDDTDKGDEFKLFLNEDKINGTDFCTTGCTAERDIDWTFDLANNTTTGTNTVAVYLDTFTNDDGEINDFGDDDNIELWSNPEAFPDNSSALQYSYEVNSSGLVFGKIDLSRSEETNKGQSNPYAFNHTFNQSATVLESFVHLAQLDNENVTVRTRSEGDEFSTAFTASRDFATPTDIFIDPDKFNTSNVNNTINITDDCTNLCDILNETSFERRLLVDSQVGYGDTFQNKSNATDNAKERLNNTLGPFIDATQIVSETLSINRLPWLFGPVTVEIEVWQK
jgi:hypothetical protein